MSGLGLELFVASIVFSFVFVLGYFSLYNRENREILFYPEGKYGPPLIREQFVGILVCSLISGLLGAVNIGWLSDIHVLSSQERLNVEEHVKFAIGRVISLVPLITGVALLSYMFVMGAYGSIMLRTLRMFLKHFIPLRPTFHSFRTCVEPRLLYHLVWCCIGQVILWEGLSLVVNLIFANSFRVSKKTSRPMQTLLDGLKNSKHKLIQRQAIFELHQILMKDPEERQLLFTEFIDGKTVSREITEWLISRLKSITDDIKLDMNILHEVATILNSNDTEVRPAMEPRRSVQSIFASRPESFINGIARMFFPKPSTEPVIIHEPRVPAALLFRSKVVPQVEAEQEQKVVQLTWLSRHSANFSQTTLGRLILGLSVQYYRSRHILECETSCTWIVEALSRLSVVSYDEDKYGQVQFCLDPLLGSILDSFFILLELHSSPRLNDPSLIYEPPAITDQTESAFHHLLQTCSIAIDDINRVFGSAFPAVLSREVRASLTKYHDLIAQCSEDSQ